MNAAANLFIQDGASAVTMDRVASVAGMSKRTLYLQFKNREALLKAVADSLFGPIAANVEPVLADADNDPVSACRTLLEFVSKHLARIGARQAELRYRDPEVWDHIVELRRRVVLQPLKELLVRAGRQGLLNPDVDPDVVVEVVPTLIEALAQSAILSTSFTVADVMDLLAELFTNGLFVDPPNPEERA